MTQLGKCRGLTFRRDTPHPTTGGKKILLRVAGKDASKMFWKYHGEAVLKKYKPKLQVGSLDTKKAAAPAPAAAAPAPAPKPAPAAAPAKPAEKKAEAAPSEALEPYGSLIPFADPNWYQGVSSALLPLNRQPRLLQPQFLAAELEWRHNKKLMGPPVPPAVPFTNPGIISGR